MLVVLGEQQHAALAHEFDDLRIRFEDALTGEVFDLRREASGVIDRAIDLQTVSLADYKVVVTVSGRGVDAAGSCFAGRLFSRASLTSSSVSASASPPSVTCSPTINSDGRSSQAWRHSSRSSFDAGKTRQHFGRDRIRRPRRVRPAHISRQLRPAIRWRRCKPRRRVQTPTYSKSGWTAMPRLAGSVQGVVVQISTNTLRPASAGSINAGSLRKRKLHVNRRTRVLVVFDFGFGQRRLIVNAPVDRPRAFVDVATLDEASKQPRRFRFVVVRHREVRIVPLAQNAEPLEVSRLALQCLGRVFTAGAANRTPAACSLSSRPVCGRRTARSADP